MHGHDAPRRGRERRLGWPPGRGCSRARRCRPGRGTAPACDTASNVATKVIAGTIDLVARLDPDGDERRAGARRGRSRGRPRRMLPQYAANACSNGATAGPLTKADESISSTKRVGEVVAEVRVKCAEVEKRNGRVHGRHARHPSERCEASRRDPTMRRVPRTLHLVENASVPTDPRVWPECQALRDAGWAVTVVSPRGSRARRARARDDRRCRDSPLSIRPRARWRDRVPRASTASRSRSLSGVVRRLAQEDDVRRRPRRVATGRPPARSPGGATPRRRDDPRPSRPEPGAVRGEVRTPGRRAPVAPARGASRIHARGRRHLGERVVSTSRDRARPQVTRRRLRRSQRARSDRVPTGHAGRLTRARRRAPHRLRRPDGSPGRRLRGARRARPRSLDLRTDWHAVFVGDGETLEPARELAAGPRLAGRVSFLGFVSDRARIVEILSSCDVCLSPEPRNPLNDTLDPDQGRGIPGGRPARRRVRSPRDGSHSRRSRRPRR